MVHLARYVRALACRLGFVPALQKTGLNTTPSVFLPLFSKQFFGLRKPEMHLSGHFLLSSVHFSVGAALLVLI